MNTHPIGVFDSGYGGLTILKEIINELPSYDYLYLGDNARAPYGTRSFDTVYKYTLEAVKWFFTQGCPLVVLACNTASAKALRTIQQNDLPSLGDKKRVLGVIRPTSEVIGEFSKSGHVGIFGTPGTIQSESYPIEISKFFPEIRVTQEACPMWVPLLENGEKDSPATDHFIKRHIDNLLEKDADIDTVLLGCTHYPLLVDNIRKYLPDSISLVSQGEIVAKSLKIYLQRHSTLVDQCSQKAERVFVTTGDVPEFEKQGTIFFGETIKASHVEIAG